MSQKAINLNQTEPNSTINVFINTPIEFKGSEFPYPPFSTHCVVIHDEYFELKEKNHDYTLETKLDPTVFKTYAGEGATSYVTKQIIFKFSGRYTLDILTSDSSTRYYVNVSLPTETS